MYVCMYACMHVCISMYVALITHRYNVIKDNDQRRNNKSLNIAVACNEAPIIITLYSTSQYFQSVTVKIMIIIIGKMYRENV